MFDKLDASTLAWLLFGIYLAVTFLLAWIGHKRTTSFASFAIGKRDMGPGVAGLTLGACLASTATFVINPGFVYAYGLSALIALTLPFFAGMFCGLALLGPGFRRHGAKALTLPRWVGERYGSAGLRSWFAALSLLNVFYIVLIVVGSAYIMVATMGVAYPTAVTIVVAVVFSYVCFGGTYAHAYTNTAQGAIMLVVALLIFGRVLFDFGGAEDAVATLGAEAHYLSLTHPESPFYRNLFEVLLCPFIMGFAVVSQPHLLIKTLYLKSSRDMARFLCVGGGSFVVFSLVLFAGLAARLRFGGELGQDVATARWLAEAFPPLLGAVVGVAILAAAMSTLDGLLVAVSAIVGADMVSHPRVARFFRAESEPARERLALRAGRVTIIVLGLLAWLLALDPPSLVGIFGQVGVFGMLAATVPAILYGVLRRSVPPTWTVALASVLGLAIHLALYCSGVTENTTLTASLGLMVALPLPLLLEIITLKLKEKADVPGTVVGEMESLRS